MTASNELWITFGRQHKAYDAEGKGLRDLAADYVQTLATRAASRHGSDIRHARCVMIEAAINQLGGWIDFYANEGRMKIYGPGRKVYARF